MSKRGPIVTLVLVAVVAAVLLVVNMTVRTQSAGREGAAPPSGTAVAPAPPPAVTSPAVAPETVTYAGRTSGNEATIAIAVRAGRAAAYVCDGRSVEAWLQGTITDGRLSVQGARGASATGTLAGDAMFGTVSMNGQQWPYSARRAAPPAGLYQGRGTVSGVPARLGWIVLPDQSQVGIGNFGGRRSPAPALRLPVLSPVTVDGTRIEPQQVFGDTQVVGVPGGPPS
ncbi:MAG TPA: hypothetical protein VFO16_11310 [Pseudonocardiaceae bacterium]|nr:hypothetical protein [Pseudonocardiaceae bacterium]